MVSPPVLTDAVAFITFTVLTLGYHWFYLTVVRHNPSWSVRARMHEHRRNWVESVFKRGERIMAVQALRNLIMTNTFLASTMILLVAFISNFVVLQDPSESLHLQPGESTLAGATDLRVKGVLLILLYSFAFVMFLTGLRTLNHLSLLVSVDPEQIRAIEQTDPVSFLTLRLNQVESWTTYGRRAVYFSIPVFGWFFSPWLFLILTVLIWIYFVAYMDFVKQPRKKPKEKSEAAPLASSAPVNK